MQPVKKKCVSIEELVTEFESLRKLPRNQWIEKINTLAIKNLISQNQNLLISNPDKALEELTLLKKRLKNVSSENKDKQTNTLKAIKDSCIILANLSGDEEEDDQTINFTDLLKELESIRKLDKDQWFEKINDYSLNKNINKNVDLLTDNAKKALQKLSQLKSRLEKEPSSNKEAQEKTLNTLSRMIDLVSLPSDDEIDEESVTSETTAPQALLLPSSTSNSLILSQQPAINNNLLALPSSSSALSISTSSVRDSSGLIMPQRPEPLGGDLMTRMKEIRNSLGIVVPKNLPKHVYDVDVNPGSRNNWISKVEDSNFELELKEMDSNFELSLNIAIRERNSEKAVMEAIENEMEYVNLSYFLDLDNEKLKSLFNLNPKMKAIWIDQCENITKLPTNDNGFALTALYCNNCLKLESIDFSSFPNLEIFDANNCPNLINTPRNNKNLKIININNCRLLPVIKTLPNMKQTESKYVRPAGMAPYVPYEKVMHDELWKYASTTKIKDEDELISGAKKIHEKFASEKNSYKDQTIDSYNIKFENRLDPSLISEADRKAELEGKPRYWREIEQFNTIADTFKPCFIRVFDLIFPADERGFKPRAYYTILNNYWKQKNKKTGLDERLISDFYSNAIRSQLEIIFEKDKPTYSEKIEKFYMNIFEIEYSYLEMFDKFFNPRQGLFKDESYYNKLLETLKNKRV